jgi:class 3 adenylate cyclase
LNQTAQKLEPTLAEELALYDDLLIPVCAVDEDGVIQYFNSMFGNFAKLPPRKLRGKPLKDILNCPVVKGGELLTRAFREWAPLVSEENSIDVGVGEIRDAIFKVIPHTSHDGKRWIVVSVQDISIERILHEKHRVQLDELKAKNAEIKKYSEGLELLVEERTSELRASMEQSERLLLNILPKKIAERLKSGEGTIADRFDSVSVMFADIVSFTPISSSMDPVHVVEFLSATFEAFDALLDRHGVEKIKTIGDAYLAVAGVPIWSDDHAVKICNAALDMRDEVEKLASRFSFKFEVRFGINSGPVVAGVLGMKKFAYDIWGDVVNVAARMESHGTPNKIQIAQETYELVKDKFVFEDRGIIEVKGKGPTRAYFLVGRKG